MNGWGGGMNCRVHSRLSCVGRARASQRRGADPTTKSELLIIDSFQANCLVNYCNIVVLMYTLVGNLDCLHELV